MRIVGEHKQLKKVKKPKVRSKALLMRLLDGQTGRYSAMIRKRDEGKPCVDRCGREGVKQSGHFKPRGRMSTRLDYRNTNGQNAYCNAWDNDLYNMAKEIDLRWGIGTADELDIRSRELKSWDRNDLEELLEATGDYEEYVTVYNRLML